MKLVILMSDGVGTVEEDLYTESKMDWGVVQTSGRVLLSPSERFVR